MQVSSIREKPEFQPISITITVESQEEWSALLAYASRPNVVAAGTLIHPMTNNEQKTMRDFLRMLDKALIDPV